jgi:hypothetical protein
VYESHSECQSYITSVFFPNLMNGFLSNFHL